MSEVTELLQRWNSGDAAAREAIIERIYGELGGIARRYLADERANVDLQPTALVHEAYMRLIGIDRIEWQGRSHFLAMAARVMREYLVDAARRRNARKRDGGIQVTLAGVDGAPDQATEILALNEALDRLAEADPDRALLVELRFFGGLTIEETAEVLDTSATAVKRSWRVARGWLYQHMQAGGSDDG
ncbi:MAG: ECF-type sigma factor [Pseudomonadota bacterium]